MRLPAAEVEWRSKQAESDTQPWWVVPLFLGVIMAILFGLYEVSHQIRQRDLHHPQYYGDFRGGYAHGAELRADGLSRRECSEDLQEPYATPTSDPERRAAWMFNAGCVRGALGKPIGDVAARVDRRMNVDRRD